MQSDYNTKPVVERNSDDPKHQADAIYLDNVKDDQYENTRNGIPESIRNLSPEERKRAEKALVRRIDLRLLPMLVLMVR